MTHLPPSPTLRRRTLLQSAGGALIVAFTLPSGRSAQAADTAIFAPNAFVRIAPDNSITVLSKHLEMGQGVYTGLARILAEELDADWANVRVESAPADVKFYANLALGMQLTGGSTAIANSYEQLRKAGATARALLVQAAAQAWHVPSNEITVTKGVIAHAASNHRATFGDMAGAAAHLPVPADVPVKDPKDFTLIGQPVNRIDTPPKTNGTARYGLDMRLPGMVTAVIARAPRFGGKVKSFDAQGALAMPGVKQVFAVPSGVAVIADSYWSALRGRDALRVEWDDSAAEKRSSEDLAAEYRALLDQPGTTAKTVGDVAAAFRTAAKVLTLDYEVPYLAHAPMEPLNCVAQRGVSGCELWYGCQFQTVDQGNVAKALGLKPEQVVINTLFAGGSFGRRANTYSDFVVETVEIAKQLPVGVPVRLVWPREDDIRGGRYRPMYSHRLKAGLDAKGNLIAWQHRVVGQSIVAGTTFEAMIQNGIDSMSVEGAANLPYQIPNLLVDLHTTKVGVPVLWWRSVGSSHNAFVTEAFIDRVAHEAGRDPLAFRLALLPETSRHRKVLELAAEKAGWSQPLPAGRARGLAVAEAFDTVVAEVVEVSRGKDGQTKVDRVVCALDCGVAVNPNGIAAQMEGGIAFGLGAALKGEITLDRGGRVEQGNFDTYDVLRMSEMPAVDVHIYPSSEKPTGTGEPGVPPIAPALANAIHALTGKPITSLPISRGVSA